MSRGEKLMPTYCYKTNDDQTREHQCRMGKAPETIMIFGKVAHRDYAAEHGGSRQAGGEAWPIECVGSGVNAAQAPELRKLFKDHSFGCEVTNDGDPVYTSPGHRKKALAIRGLHDNNSFS